MAQFVVSTDHDDGELFVNAAKWLARFYRSVDVIIGDHSISLRSGRVQNLEQIWAAALFNERSLVRCSDQRRQYIEQLVS